MVRQVQSVTSIDASPDAERRARAIKYTIAMTVRVICVVLAVVVQGWAMWIFFAGAIFLPYFAVVLANAAGSGRISQGLTKVEAPVLRIEADQFVSPEEQKTV